ncbi:uncharacterized protein LOC135487855 [Lineus longissimus]|uniref:uncharacterized protein LOC135487855 n=1 Tax=Lineus longissimus TaxID=88925 RepID=UPI00315CED99
MSVRELSKNPIKLNAFLRAWKLITALPTDNPNSFWNIAGFHGAPFVPPKTPLPDLKYWGGWCQHNNVLFPTWHRFHMLSLEQALRTVCPEDDVTLPYWDATSEESMKEGIPKLLTDDTVEIDGKKVTNPLRSYTLPMALGRADDQEEYYYEKPKGYETVRYPYSGICSPKKAKLIADAHNKQVPKTLLKRGNKHAVDALNDNVIEWLNRGELDQGKKTRGIEPNSVYVRFETCLSASNYNTFSNRHSQCLNGVMDVSVECPHDSLHLAIGGYDMKKKDEKGRSKRSRFGLIVGANGDMGENETAAFDPIFFFHHCNIDRMFWVWQKKNGFIDNFDIDPNDKRGTNPNEGQGYTHGQAPDEKLSMDTPLYPFQAPNGVQVTSMHCINIKRQLGYTYTKGSFDGDFPEYEGKCQLKKNHFAVKNLKKIKTELRKADKEKMKTDKENLQGPSRLFFDVTNVKKWSTKKPTQSFQFPSSGFEWVGSYLLKVNNIDQDRYKGSFLVRAYYKNKKQFIGQRSFLNRFERRVCRNCQFHRFLDVFFNLNRINLTLPLLVSNFKVEVVSKNYDKGKQKITNLSFAKATRKDTDRKPYLTFHNVFTGKLVRPQEIVTRRGRKVKNPDRYASQ